MDIPARARSGLTKAQTRQTLNSFILSNVGRSIFECISAGMTITFSAFVLSLGVAKEDMGILAACLSAACVLQVVSVELTRWVRDKKRFVLSLAMAEPAIMIAAVLLVPALAQDWRLPVLAVACFVAAGALHLTMPVSEEWVASAVPSALRGRFIGRRMQWVNIVGASAMLGAALLADGFTGMGSWGLAAILATGGFFGLLSVVALRKAELPALSASTAARWVDLPRTLRVVPFRRYLMVVAFLNIPFFLSTPYYHVFNLEVLQLTKTQTALILLGYFAVKTATLPFSARLVNRWGSRRVLRAACLVYVLFFLFYPLSAVIGPVAVGMAWAVAGVSDGAWNVAVTTAQYSSVPMTRDRPAFFAVANLWLRLLGMIGAFASAYFLGAVKELPELHLGPYTFGHFHLLYGTMGALMAMVTFGTRWFPDRAESEAGAKAHNAMSHTAADDVPPDQADKLQPDKAQPVDAA